MQSEVAVVLPCYNAEPTLQRALDSVYAQTYKDFHICAVDDGSKDRTRQVLAANGCLYVSLVHGGPAAARNRAIRMSRSPFIAFLDADDEWLPRKLERQISLLKKEPNIGMVCTRCVLHGSADGDGRASHDVAMSGRLFQALALNCFVFTPSVVIRRDCIEEVGLFQESLSVSEDFNLWLRIAARWRIAYLPEPLAIIHKSPDSLSATISDAERLKGGIAALQDVQANCGQLPPPEAKALRQALARRFYTYGSFLLKTGDTRPSRTALALSLKLQKSNWRALAKLAISFLPVHLFQPLSNFGVRSSSRIH
jgi:glycosyltransferase involved in cell wall biosynthesis